jgi:MinD-like ATPase involved in chromosome partitioning or flagellar assembly
MGARKYLMHSFKGGAGRTVSTANLAYSLAVERGKRVLLIDLDLESAGSSVLFGIEKEVDSGDVWTIQDVFRGIHQTIRDGRASEESVNIGTHDFEQKVWPNLHRTIYESADHAAYLKIIPASTTLKSSDEIKSGPRPGAKLELLMRRIDGLTNAPDFILFDSASGIQDTAVLGLQRCDDLVVFARWSRQFIYGTSQFLRKYVASNAAGRRIARVFVIPTAVPEEKPPTGYLRDELRSREEMLDDAIARANQEGKLNFEHGPGWISRLPPVHECNSLKWDDRVFLMDSKRYRNDVQVQKLLRDYSDIADALFGKTGAA